MLRWVLYLFAFESRGVYYDSMDKNINPQLKDIYDRVMNTPVKPGSSTPAQNTIPTVTVPNPAPQVTQTVFTPPPIAPTQVTPQRQITPLDNGVPPVTTVAPPAASPAPPPQGFTYSAKEGMTQPQAIGNNSTAMEKVEPASKKMTVLIVVFLSAFVIAYTVFWFLVFRIIEI